MLRITGTDICVFAKAFASCRFFNSLPQNYVISELVLLSSSSWCGVVLVCFYQQFIF
jgi:hypothetical protein